MEGEDVAMMPPKKRGAAAVSAGEDAGDPKRAKGASGRAARAAGRGHDDVPEEQEHPQADVAQEAIEAAAEQAPSKRARKPSAKQAAAAQQALEQVATQDAAAAEQPSEVQPKAEQPAEPQEGAAAPPQLPPELAPPAPEEQLPLQQQQQPAADATADAAPPPEATPDQAAPYAAVAAVGTAGEGAAAPQPQPPDAQAAPPTEAHAAAAAAQPIAMAAAGDAAAPPEHQAHLAAADPGQQQPPQQQQQQLQPQEMQGYDATHQQQQLEAAHQAQLQQLYAQQHMDAHAQGGVQPEGAPGDLQALFDPSALVVGIALVVPDENGQDAHHDPVAISVHAQATVADLKQRIFSTSIYGQTFPPAQQELQMITPEGQGIFMEEASPQGQPHSLADYGLTPGGPHRPTLYLRIRAGEVVPGEGGAVAQEQPELNPDGTEKKKRRQHTRWKEEEVMRLLEGVESLGVGHWRQMQRDFNLMDRTDVDLKDKWRNITKAIAQNKKMRGFNMAADMMLRVQNCMRLAQEKKAAKQLNEAASAAAQVAGQGLDMLEGGAPAPLEHQQVQHADSEAAAAAAAAQQAAAEGAAVQGVLDGALPQQAEGDVHVDIMDPAGAGGQYQQQLQAPDQSQPQQQPQQQQGPELMPPQQQDLVAAAAAAHAAEQAQQQQQYHAGGHDHDPGAVVMPVPQFEDVGHQQGGDAAAGHPTSGAALPSAPPLDI